tara:strand:+ start:1426 stop:2208 length:783 start_codon:yes stop_codon:yes gene_type:complete
MSVEKNIRIIARLDVKGQNLVKGIHLEGLRVLGKPREFSLDYFNQGIDEIIYHDCVASLYGRNSLKDVIKDFSNDVFVPITVGGGIRSIKDAYEILRSGADKIAINTAAIKNPKLIEEIAKEFGSQCMVLSVEAKQNGNDYWEAYTDNGREKTGLSVIDWIKKGIEHGAGEILITSIDMEGTRKGSDLKLLNKLSPLIKVPLIYSGGIGNVEHFLETIKIDAVDGIAMADIFHYKLVNVKDIRNSLINNGISTRYTKYDK